MMSQVLSIVFADVDFGVQGLGRLGLQDAILGFRFFGARFQMSKMVFRSGFVLANDDF